MFTTNNEKVYFMKKIGLGIQDFAELKEKNFIYVDKTESLHQLIDEGKYYFLSRPRRFGKSLLVSTLKELFEGNKKLFEGCWNYDQWNWDDQYTVLKIDFTSVQYQELGLKKALDHYLTKLATVQGVQLESEVYSGKFLELIEKLGEKKPVVILIDEYDKPIIDDLERSKTKQADDNREILKTLYAGVKNLDRYIRFLFVTGISKFSKVSIFSDLNHLRDITLSKNFARIVGYTEEEVREYYKHYLKQLALEFELSEDEIMKRVAFWYNGYSWDGKTFLFNPYSVINLFIEREFKNYWFESGTPTFLINKLKDSDKRINSSINKLVKESAFNKYDIETVNTTALMFQTGYLTIKEFNRDKNQ